MEQNSNLHHNDEQAVKMVLAGHTQAYGALVQRYWKLALAMAYSRCQNAEIAEDIAQDSFIKAYTNLSTLRNPSQFAGWLNKIIHRECINYHRNLQNQALVSPQLSGQLNSLYVPKSNPGLSRQQVDLVHQAIRKLPEHMQNVIIMRFVGGLPLKEIAQQIEIKYGTVRVWLHRAYQLLKEDLAPILKEVQS